MPRYKIRSILELKENEVRTQTNSRSIFLSLDQTLKLVSCYFFIYIFKENLNMDIFVKKSSMHVKFCRICYIKEKQ